MASGKILGKVVEISADGNLITDITAEQLHATPRDVSVSISCDDHETNGIFTPDHKEPPFTFLALLGESGRLELVIVGDSAKIMLGVRTGTPVKVTW
jgi:S-adenosyl-L-methionine hydrolase (adenosine-forming)